MSTPALVDLVCVVLEDAYGSIGARIMRTLLNEGQLSMPELARSVQLPVSAVQRTLISLITNRFVLFWQRGPRTLYFGNWKQVYHVLWAGQLLAQHADPPRRVKRETPSETAPSDGTSETAPNDEPNEEQRALADAVEMGLVPASPANASLIRSGALVPVLEWQFWPEAELVHSLQTRKAREIADSADSVGKSVNAQRVQMLAETQNELERIKSGGSVDPAQDQYRLNRATSKTPEVYEINWDRFLVKSRRREFAAFAAREIGEASGAVYDIVLRLSERGLRNVKERRVPSLESAVTTQQIVAQLDEALVAKLASAFVVENSENAENGKRGSDTSNTTNGTNGYGNDAKRIKTNSGAAAGVKMRPAELVNKHLDLLVESRAADFVQRLGTRQGGEWFVPFDKVNARLKQSVFDSVIVQSFGEPAGRLVNLIRQRGKLDEKMLGTFALLPASEIRHQMSALSYFGFADIQELAKPSDRSSGGGAAAAAAQKRSMFLWYHRPEWAYQRLLDQLYGQLASTIAQSRALRQEHLTLLTKLSREDVKSNTDEFLTAKEHEELDSFRSEEQALFRRMNMLDRHVRIFREY